MRNRFNFFRIWRKLPKNPPKWFQYLRKSALKYGGSKYWPIYLAAFGLGFFMFGPAHGWHRLQQQFETSTMNEPPSSSMVILQKEVERLKNELKRLSFEEKVKPPFSPEAFVRPASGKVVQEYRWMLEDRIWRLHPGVEIALPAGSSVVAAADGTVLVSDQTKQGYSVTLDHGSEWESVYSHLDQVMVSKGQQVKKGQVVGKSGIAICVAPAQAAFHFGIYHGKEPVNPQKIISDLK